LNDDPVLPPADEPAAADTDASKALTDANRAIDGADEPLPDTKPEKTEAERERMRMQRGIDRKTRQAAEAKAEAAQLRDELARLRGNANSDINTQQTGDSDTLTLSRAEIAALIKQEASRLAPTITQQQTEIEQRRGIVSSLSKAWGAEKFDAMAAELDEAVGGLADRTGRPKPVADAIFESDRPQALIEYLADPDNADEADVLSRMSPIQVGRAVAKLESKLAALSEQSKPQPSKAATPPAAVRGQGAAPTGYSPHMTDAQYAAFRKRQIAQRR
jgi:hypothetical protein